MPTLIAYSTSNTSTTENLEETEHERNIKLVVADISQRTPRRQTEEGGAFRLGETPRPTSTKTVGEDTILRTITPLPINTLLATETDTITFYPHKDLHPTRLLLLLLLLVTPLQTLLLLLP